MEFQYTENIDEDWKKRKFEIFMCCLADLISYGLKHIFGGSYRYTCNSLWARPTVKITNVTVIDLYLPQTEEVEFQWSVWLSAMI